jgi:hypothetical protein
MAPIFHYMCAESQWLRSGIERDMYPRMFSLSAASMRSLATYTPVGRALHMMAEFYRMHWIAEVFKDLRQGDIGWAMRDTRTASIFLLRIAASDIT